MDFFDFDDDYVRRLREGDRETGEHFQRYFRDLLFVMLRRRLSSPMAIEDVIQTVFLGVWKDLHKLRDSARLGAFVKGYADNVLKEYYRKTARTTPLGDKFDPISDDDPFYDLYIADLQVLVRRVLAELAKESPKDAAVLCAVYLDEEDKDEVCRRYGITRDYLRVVLHRAKEKFRTLLKRRDDN